MPMNAKERAALAQLESFKRATEERRKKLADAVQLCRTPGDFDASRYSHGFANGMILALSVVEATAPDYVPQPSRYLDECEQPEQVKATPEIVNGAVDRFVGKWIDQEMKAGRVAFDPKQIADIRIGLRLALES